MKHKVIVVVGPTAVGKTKIAIELAKKYQLEIISGDWLPFTEGWISVRQNRPKKNKTKSCII